MISLAGVVSIVIYLLVAAAIFGLLYWLITYCETQFPGGGPFFRFARIALVVLAVLVIIGILLSFVGGGRLLVVPGP